MAARVCSAGGCALIIPDGQKYRDDCARCQTRMADSKPWATKQRVHFYHTARWQKVRAWKLAINPVCQVCSDALATEVDHKKSVSNDTPDLWYDPENLQSICKPCHKKKTATTRRGV